MKSGTTKTSNKDDLRSRFAAALKDIDEKTQLINGKKAVVKETFDNLSSSPASMSKPRLSPLRKRRQP